MRTSPSAGRCAGTRRRFRACNCGLSAYYELAEEPDLPAPDAVWGAIVAWGRVVECETGFRAQYARPIALLDAYNPLDFARPLKRARDAAEAHGIPLCRATSSSPTRAGTASCTTAA